MRTILYVLLPIAIHFRFAALPALPETSSPWSHRGVDTSGSEMERLLSLVGLIGSVATQFALSAVAEPEFPDGHKIHPFDVSQMYKSSVPWSPT